MTESEDIQPQNLFQEQFAEKIKCLKAESEKRKDPIFLPFYDAKRLFRAQIVICKNKSLVDVQSNLSPAVRWETSLELSLRFGQRTNRAKVLSVAKHCRAQKMDPEHAK